MAIEKVDDPKRLEQYLKTTRLAGLQWPEVGEFVRSAFTQRSIDVVADLYDSQGNLEHAYQLLGQPSAPAPAEHKMLYAISGRIPEAPDDAMELIVASTEEDAKQSFRALLTSDLAPSDIGRLIAEHGEACFVVECRLIGEYLTSGSLRVTPELALKQEHKQPAVDVASGYNASNFRQWAVNFAPALIQVKEIERIVDLLPADIATPAIEVASRARLELDAVVRNHTGLGIGDYFRQDGGPVQRLLDYHIPQGHVAPRMQVAPLLEDGRVSKKTHDVFFGIGELRKVDPTEFGIQPDNDAPSM